MPEGLLPAQKRLRKAFKALFSHVKAEAMQCEGGAAPRRAAPPQHAAGGKSCAAKCPKGKLAERPPARAVAPRPLPSPSQAGRDEAGASLGLFAFVIASLTLTLPHSTRAARK